MFNPFKFIYIKKFRFHCAKDALDDGVIAAVTFVGYLVDKDVFVNELESIVLYWYMNSLC